MNILTTLLYYRYNEVEKLNYEGLSDIKTKNKNLPTNITIKNFDLIKGDKDFLSYGTSSKPIFDPIGKGLE